MVVPEILRRPSVTFIIPVRPGIGRPRALDTIAKLDYPRELVEVVVVEGENPSKQRNRALARASGMKR